MNIKYEITGIYIDITKNFVIVITTCNFSWFCNYFVFKYCVLQSSTYYKNNDLFSKIVWTWFSKALLINSIKYQNDSNKNSTGLNMLNWTQFKNISEWLKWMKKYYSIQIMKLYNNSFKISIRLNHHIYFSTADIKKLLISYFSTSIEISKSW